MKLPVALPLLAWVYLLLLSLGYLSIGWLMSAFQVPWPVRIGTLGMTLYIVKTGADAIALASTWTVGIIAAGAVAKAWIVSDPQLPHTHAQLWAAALLMFWLWTLVLIVLLAFASRPMQAIAPGKVQGSTLLLILVWAALGTGQLLYH